MKGMEIKKKPKRVELTLKRGVTGINSDTSNRNQANAVPA
jgi:hypothetical protein